MRRAVVAMSAAAALVGGLFAFSEAVVPSDAAWTDTVGFGSEVATAPNFPGAPGPNPENQVIPVSNVELVDVKWTFDPTKPYIQRCLAVTLKGTSEQPAPWSFRIVGDGPALGISVNGGDNKIWTVGPNAYGVTWGYPDWLLFSGRQWSNLEKISAADTVELQFECNGVDWRKVADRPDMYTVNTGALEAVPGHGMCVPVNIQGNADLEKWPFLYGWRANVDVTALRAYYNGSADNRALSVLDANRKQDWSRGNSSGVDWTTTKMLPLEPSAHELLAGTRSISLYVCL